MTLAADGVTVDLAGDRILADVSVSVEPGEVLTVVGPSGAGKTTLLRTLALFGQPADGTVLWDGRDVWSLSEPDRLAVRRRIAMVFQTANLFDASVRRNITYGRRVRRPWRERLRRGVSDLLRPPVPVSAALDRVGLDGSIEPAEPPAAVVEALETVGLAELVDRNALSLSGGEAQRVAFARALAVDPAVVLLDEPASNLDPRNTAILEAAIGRARERGVGVVVATHDMHQAERISDRVGFVLDGELVEVAPPGRLFESPSDPRTRRFVDGELIYDGGRADG